MEESLKVKHNNSKLNLIDFSNKLICKIVPYDNFDKNCFSEYRDFCFNLNSQEFEQIASKQFPILLNYYVQSFSLSNSEYKTEILKTLAFMGFRITTSTPRDKISILASSINDCSLKDLGYILIIVKNTFEMHFQDIDKNVGFFASGEFFSSVKKRCYHMLNNYKTLNNDESVHLIALMELALVLVKTVENLNEIYNDLQEIIRSIIALDIPEDFSYSQKITIFNIQVKGLLLLSHAALGKNLKQTDKQQLFDKCVSFVKYAQDIPVSILEMSRRSTNNFLNQTQNPIFDSIPKALQLVLNFKYYTDDNFILFKSTIKKMVEVLITNKLYTKDILIHLSKFAAGILHFSVISSYLNSLSIFASLMPFIKPPHDDQQTTSCLFALLFSSIDTAIVEVTTKVETIKLFIIKQQGATAMDQRKLSEYVEVFTRLLKILENFIALLCPKRAKLERILYKSFTMSLHLIHISIIYSCFRHALLFLMKLRSVFQHANIPDKKTDSSFKQYINMKSNAEKIIKLRKQHSQATKLLLKCMFYLPSIMIGNIWDYFLEDFFALDEHILLDTFFLRTILQEANTLCSFINSLVSYLFSAFNKGYNITYLIRSLTIVLEHLIRKPMNVVRTQEICSEITSIMLILKPIFCEYTKSPVYCVEILNLIKVLCQFVDFIVGNMLQFSHMIFNEKFVNETCKNADSVGASSAAICSYIKFLLSINPEFINLSIVLTCLVNAMKTEFLEPFELIEMLYKKKKDIFIGHKSVSLLFSILVRNLNTVDKNLKPRILKMLKHVPSHQITYIDKECNSVSSWKNLIFKAEKQTIIIEFDKFIHGVNCAISESPYVDKLWEVAKILASSVLDSKEWTIENRKYFHSLLACLFPIRNKNEAMFLSVFTQIIEEYKENVPVLAHLFCANYTYFESPPHEIIDPIISSINTKELMTIFINEISLISDLHIFPHKSVNKTICAAFTKVIDKKLINPVVFATFVHRVVLDLYNPEWLKYQKLDCKTNFMELDFVQRSLQNVIIFARDLLKDSDQSILPILYDLRNSSIFFSILLQAELVSECKYTTEVHDFFEECFSDETLRHGFDIYRFIGPLFRAFPDALDDFMEETRELVNSKISDLQSYDDKQKGTFIALLVPVLQNEKFGFKYYNEILPIIIRFLDFQNNFIKCQTQLVAKCIVENGPQEARDKIKNYCTNKMKSADLLTFDNNPNKLTSINWKLLNTTLFSSYLIFPKLFINIFIKQLSEILPSITDPSIQNQSRREFIPYLHALCSFIATGSVVNHLISDGLYQKVAELFAIIFFQISLLPRNKFIAKVVDFFEFAPEQFVIFFNNSLNNGKYLQFLSVMLSDSISYPLFKSVEDKIIPNVLEALRSPDRVVYNSLLAYISTVFESSKSNEELIELIYQILLNIIDTFNNCIMFFFPLVFDKLLEFFRINHTKRFLQIAFKIIEANNPLLITKYAQQYSFIIKKKILTNESFKSLEFSTNEYVNSQFFLVIVFHYLQFNNESIDNMLKFVKEKCGLCTQIILMNNLLEKHAAFDFAQYKPIDLYNEADNDKTRIQVFVYWSLSKSSENFMELFMNLMDHVHVSIPLEIKSTIDTIKIPEEASEDDLNKIIKVIKSKINLLNMHMEVIPHLYKFLSNNQAIFKQPLTSLLKEEIQMQSMPMYNTQKKDVFTNLNVSVELASIMSIDTDLYHKTLASRIFTLFIKFIELYDGFKNIPPDFFKLIPVVIKNLPIQSPLLNEFMSTFLKLDNLRKANIQKLLAMYQLQQSNYQVVSQQPQQQQLQQTASIPHKPTAANISKIVPQQIQKAIIQQQLQKAQQLHKIGQQVSPANNQNSMINLMQQKNTVNAENNLFKNIIYVFPEIVETLAKFSGFPHLDSTLHYLIKCVYDGSWSNSLVILNYLADSSLYCSKTLEIIGIPSSEEQLSRVFQILWLHPPQKNARLHILIPFALKYCAKNVLGIPQSNYDADAIMLCILDNPYEGSTSIIIRAAEGHIETIHDEESISFIVRFLSQGYRTNNPSPCFIEILNNFLMIPIIASLFFQRGSPNAIDIATEKISLPIRLKNIFRLYPKLDKDAEKILNQIPKDELIEFCKSKDIYSIPFACYVSTFFNVPVIHMLKVAKFISPIYIAEIMKNVSLDRNYNEPNIEFKFGACDISKDFNIMEWNNSLSQLSNDINYSNMEIAHYPVLRHILDYEVTVDQMTGFVPKIGFVEAKEILNNEWPIVDAAISFLKEHSSGERNSKIDADIQQFFVDISKHIRTKEYKEFQVVNELFKVRKMHKMRKDGVIFFNFLLSPNDKPSLHVAYKDLRQLIRSFVTPYAKTKIIEEDIHERIYKQSLNIHSPKIYKETTNEVLKENTNNAEALLCHLFSLNNEITPNNVLMDALIMALKVSRSNAVISILLMLLNDFDDIGVICKTLERIPSKWAIFFAKKICKETKLAQMIPLLPPSCDLIVLESTENVVYDIKRQLNTFLDPIKRTIESKRVQKIVKSVRLEKKIYSRTKKYTKKELNKLEKDFNDIYDDGQDSQELALGEFSVAPIIPPLAVNELGKSDFLNIFLQSNNASFVSMQLLTFEGTKIPYILTCGNPMNKRLSMFCKCVSEIFRKSPASFNRNLKLLSIDSLCLYDDIYLSQTTSIPYVECSVLKNMINSLVIKENHFEEKRITKSRRDFINSQDYHEFITSFSSCYGALCLIQAAFRSNCPSPFEMSINANNKIISISHFVETEEEPIFRLFGGISSFFDTYSLNGNFRIGLIAAADAIANNESKTKLFLRSVLNIEYKKCESFISIAKSFSSYADDTDDMQKKINLLIEASIECDNLIYIPWI